MYFTIFVFFSAYSIKFVKPGFIENILSKKNGMIFYEIKKTLILEQSCKNTATIQYKIKYAYF